MKTSKIVGIIILTILVIATVILLFCLPSYIDKNVLAYYGAIFTVIVTILAPIITVHFYKISEKKRKIPLLTIKVEKIMTEEYENLKNHLKDYYLCYDKEALNGNYNPLGHNPWQNVLANAFCVVELQNMNKEYGVSNLSIIIDGKEFLNNIYIKPNESYKFILGFHYGIFEWIISKEKDVCVEYKYMSVDMDQTFQQNSHFCFYIPQNSQPSIKLLNPSISKRKVIK